MEEGVIVRWMKKEGETAKPGDILFEVETDKATVGYEIQDDVVLAKILAPEGGAALAVGQPVAILVDEASDVAAFANYSAGAASDAPSAPSPAKSAPSKEAQAAPDAPAKQSEPEKSAPRRDRIFASPLARTLSEELKVDLNGLQGTGPNGRIIKADVTEASTAKSKTDKLPSKEPVKSSLPPSVSYRDIPHSSIRRVIANRLLEAKLTIPHYYLSADCELEALLK
jgi:pyruvate dehydrogenase E2 component (dihydrolipoamide acetyltransferase)